MNKNGLNPDNLISTFPEVLKGDARILALAVVSAEALTERTEEIDSIRLYTRIDELPEDLLDILAYDLKVDWYGYNYGLKAKRSQIKNSFQVQRTLGTRGAVERALRDLYPGTELDEWFEYGGDPFHFRIMLDVTDPQVDISQGELLRILNIFKPVRSHLQDNKINYRSRTNIVIETASGYVVYAARLCGTYPARATQGARQSNDIGIATESGGATYSTTMCGTSLGSLM